MHKLAKFSAYPDKVHFEGLVHLQRYIRDTNTLGLKYYKSINDAPVSDLLIKAIIKTEVFLMFFSDSGWQDFLDTGRITGAYIIFYQGRTIYHCTHFPVPVAQSSAESEYNVTCTPGMALSYFRKYFMNC